jgi:hypothetical protein
MFRHGHLFVFRHADSLKKSKNRENILDRINRIDRILKSVLCLDPVDPVILSTLAFERFWP